MEEELLFAYQINHSTTIVVQKEWERTAWPEGKRHKKSLTNDARLLHISNLVIFL
jgi:hypothetical protein